MITSFIPPVPVSIPGYPYLTNTRAITHLKGNGNYTFVHVQDTLHPLLTSQTLKYFEDRLPHFLRVSKSSLVNPAFIKEVIQQDSKTMHLGLADGTQVLVSRRRTGVLNDRLRAQLS
jgi:two-component system LytT family response regulator